MNIRLIEAKDDSSIKTLIQSSLEDLDMAKPGTAYFDPQLNSLSTYYHALPKSNYWVLVVHEKIVGGVGIAWISENTCELQKLYVDPLFQGYGYASKLMDTALAYAKKHYASCYLETHTDLAVACKLYEKYGFSLLSAPLESTAHAFMNRWYLKKLHSVGDN